jgi:hypothetical protein
MFRWFCVLTILTGCSYFVSWDDVSKPVVGHSIHEITELWGQPDEVLEQGMKKIYRYDLKKLDPSCIHYWVVDDKGIIVDFYYKGYCRPI